MVSNEAQGARASYETQRLPLGMVREDPRASFGSLRPEALGPA